MKSQVLREALFFSTTAILGPILFLGGIGYMLDRKVGTDKLYLFIGIGLAFVMTQILMFRKVKEFSKISSSFEKKTEAGDLKESPQQESI